MTQARFSPIDQLIIRADKALQAFAGSQTLTNRPSPADSCPENELNRAERKHSTGLMRVNHAGEVCAQALYQGQALTAKLPDVREKMQEAAAEEEDHLLWCQDRINQLDGHTSVLNPLWYGASFAIGAAAGLISDKVSLGFVAATEQQVCKHLESHLDSLPVADVKSRVVVKKMLADEARHAQTALEAGGIQFAAPIKALMTLTSKAMTTASYYI
ncbi:2-polyprenyl-3-methyl-6-methoxy-1,4-benzoquinone monooxygenase [Gilvimarinus polysaccharolyticus]|uniref:2-polyprenyl-3-methyl-6-methoxy-1,4-benzoquinone monooxygenase n=1 Tax=Gilvimarinus polysaccharolyticus TaxID=863921 RepID=UPI0006739D04|nr:2-polyprenyl-3-methyl-6-methoxy-1,4-benzoquinone monooxygenase [Gilvimarinus polysaccharolyticus]